MKISGFTFVKNASKLYIPVKQAIESILPICDEFVIAVGDNDNDDTTEEIINSIKSDKIRIIKTVWDKENYPKNTILAQQTDVAKDACTGDWLFYIQSDEAVHEDDLDLIKNNCQKYLSNPKVEGFLFNYIHFWGDYWHYHKSHSWYPKEIRIIKNQSDIHSWRDAQSFRKYFGEFNNTFDDYQQMTRSRKLNVVEIPAKIYHYGHARPPIVMSSKRKSFFESYHGKGKAEKKYGNLEIDFDYGPLQKLKKFTGTHPEAMKEWIEQFNWEDQLQYKSGYNKNRKKHKHEKLKYRIISFIENTFLNGNNIGGFKNYKKIKP